jgi:hypothetical protein
MMSPRTLLDMDSDELERLLIAHGRDDGPSNEARHRAIVKVTVTAAAGASLAATSITSKAATALPWLLAAKWVAVGVASGAVTIGVVQTVQRRSSPVHESATHVSSPTAVGRSASGAPLSPEPAPEARGLPPDLPTSVRAAEDPAPRRAAPRAAPPDARSIELAPSESDSTTAVDSPGSLQQELRFLDEARRALDVGAASRALDALDRYAERFPSGNMRIEGDALRIETLLALRQTTAAPSLAKKFLAKNATSPTAMRVQRLLEAMEDVPSKK